MTFNPAEHPRATDGTFAEKVGASPEIALPRDEGMGIIYTDLDVLQYAKDYYGEDWETSEDRETILAERRDEYLTYRQTTDGIVEAARYFTGGFVTPDEYGQASVPKTVSDNAVDAAAQIRADDVEGVRSLYNLAVVAAEHGDTDLADAMYTAVSDKLLIDARTLTRSEDGALVYNTHTVAQREKYHRAARNSLEILSSGARIPADLDHWGRVYWAAEEDRTPAELAKVLLSESEGEFARVILDHKNVTPEMVTYAARSNDGAVQHAVINHPKVTAAALQEVQARAERDYLEATDPNNAWGTMKPYFDRQAEQAVSFMKDISDARGRLGAEGAW